MCVRRAHTLHRKNLQTLKILDSVTFGLQGIDLDRYMLEWFKRHQAVSCNEKQELERGCHQRWHFAARYQGAPAGCPGKTMACDRDQTKPGKYQL